MKHKFYVMLNRNFAEDIYADFKILKGRDKSDLPPEERLVTGTAQDSAEYRKTGTQNMAANALGITQQAVSKALNRSMWKEISQKQMHEPSMNSFIYYSNKIMH